VEVISQHRSLIGLRHPAAVYFELKFNNFYFFQIKSIVASVNPLGLDMPNKRLVISYHVALAGNSSVNNPTYTRGQQYGRSVFYVVRATQQ
jgi:hypothetical protein